MGAFNCYLVYCVLVLGSLLVIPTDCLHCYQCSGISDTYNCTTKVSCQSNQKCFTETHGVGQDTTFNMGCRSEQICLTGPISLVGRSSETQTKREASCNQCCSLDDCNQALCSAGNQLINEVGQCVDDPQFNCPYVSTLFNICADEAHAKVVCRRFCGLCNLVDGKWASWSAWSSCDTTCGTGRLTRVRTCTDPAPAHGGLNCSGSAREILPCRQVNKPCPIHGGWSTWQNWGQCSATCSLGLQARQRTCSNPVPKLDGNHCFGSSNEYQACTVKGCEDGHWSSWGPWSVCNSTGDITFRNRTCTNPAPSLFGKTCLGNDKDFDVCPGVINKETVYFNAHNPSNMGPVAGTTIVYSTEVSNVGNGYNNGNGIFTAPISGVYSFSVQTCISPDREMSVELWANGRTSNKVLFENASYYTCNTVHSVTGLQKGQTVRVNVLFRSSSGHILYENTYRWCSFSGFLVNVV